MHGFYPFFNANIIYSESNSNDHLHTELVQTKLNMGRILLINIISLFGSWSIAQIDHRHTVHAALLRHNVSEFTKEEN